MVIVLFSITASFAVDENSTQMAADIQNEDIIEAENQNVVMKTSDQSALSVDYSDVVHDNSSFIVPGKVTKRYNGMIEYSATFLDSDKKPLQNTVVYCGIDSVLLGVNATTDSKGVALFLLPTQKGNHTLYLMNTVASDITSDTVYVFDVLTGNKNFNLYFNSGKSYTVRVYGDDGKPVKANQKVTFTVNFKKHTVKTDKNGYAKLKINFQPGSYLVTAQYKDYMVANKIIVKPTVIPLTQFGSKQLGKTFKYKVKLLNNKGKLFKNKNVKVKFNKKTYVSKTNKKGIATFTLKTPLNPGLYNIVSSYGKAKATAQLYRYVIR
ncbi:hypothetical protein [uncultured Methanobrevibacter sp.]|uniref:hypothetical protein n=1 Tax=uncultured Methanobrevibacter sp. TaxID=253161 RepID=UPI0025ECBA2B|nr:hypothetical protein [uncultured Methanobrevibacter sp.]